MNLKDQKLMEQLMSQMKYKTKGDIVAHYNKMLKNLENGEVTNPDLLKLKKNEYLIRMGDIGHIIDLGLADAYKNKNFKSLHDALYTYCRMSFIYSLNIGGGEGMLYRCIIEAFAACDTEAIKKNCPIYSPIITKRYTLYDASHNLMLGLLYKDIQRIEIGINQAEKAVMLKSQPLFNIAVISYLLALAKHDVQKANEQFSVIMSVYLKTKYLFEFNNPFLKIFAHLPHGLYNMAYFFLSETDFARIIPPDGTAFWNELSDYQKQIEYAHGNPFISFEGELASLNEIYET